MNTKKRITKLGILALGIGLPLSLAYIGNNTQIVNADAIDYSTTYSSNVTLSTKDGTSTSAVKVKISNKDYNGIKAGTGSKRGKIVVNIPENTDVVHFHAAGWNKEAVNIKVLNQTFSLTADSGISGSVTTFTLNGTASDYYYSISPNGATKLTFEAVSDYRFVLFGVNAVSCDHSNLTIEEGEAPNCTKDGYKDCYKCECGKYFEDSEAKTAIGYENDYLTWASEGNGKIAALGHQLTDVDYLWDDEGYCLAFGTCSREDCGKEVDEGVQGQYVKDEDATCMVEEKGHYVATFEDENFGTASTEASSVTIPNSKKSHDFSGEVTYSWNGNVCTASTTCVNEGCNEVQSQEVEGTYVKDTDATCEDDETGHYEATFTAPVGFAQTEKGSSVQEGTASGHNICETPIFTWDDDNNCTGILGCTNPGCENNIKEVVAGEYIKTQEANCTENEKGYYKASFIDQDLSNNFGESDFKYVEIPNTATGHNYEITYIEGSDTITAKATCKNPGCNSVITEVAQATMCKDTDATCYAKATGHLECDFENKLFVSHFISEENKQYGDILSHNWVIDNVEWNESTSVNVHIKCSNEGCTATETISATKQYAVDTPANCTENEKGHYYIDTLYDSNKLFAKADENSVEIEGSKKGHTWTNVTYVWDNNKCTATRSCTVTGCNEKETETVTGELIIDVPATCEDNATGHYKATFTNPAFEEQNSDSRIISNSALGHELGEYTISKDSSGLTTSKRTCSRCQKVCSQLPSRKTLIDDTDPTCTKKGTAHYQYEFPEGWGTYEEDAGSRVGKDALGHEYSEPTYTWNHEECTATCSCTREGCNETPTETVIGTYVKDSDATCHENEKGHYVATFTNDEFEEQSTETNSAIVENTLIDHALSTPTYTWDGDQCTAKVTCTNEGCIFSRTVTLQADYVKDTDATTESNEKGHYVVHFDEPFTTVSTENNSVEKQGTKIEPQPEEEGCCGSLIASSAIVTTLCSLAVSCLLAKRKEN